jgi:hypothetical protein
MTSDERARIKQCIAWFLCGEMGELRCKVVHSMMDALEDDHLTELDRMIHIYETEESDGL